MDFFPVGYRARKRNLMLARLGSFNRASPVNAITWQIFSPVSRDPGIAIPGSRLTGLARSSCNREVDFCCV